MQVGDKALENVFCAWGGALGVYEVDVRGDVVDGEVFDGRYQDLGRIHADGGGVGLRYRETGGSVRG